MCSAQPASGVERVRKGKRRRVRVRWGNLTVAILAVLLATAASVQAQEHDVVIRAGRVLDGAGNPWIAADVAIRDGRFVRIGYVPGSGRVEIDATGRYVSRGWIGTTDEQIRKRRRKRVR